MNVNHFSQKLTGVLVCVTLVVMLNFWMGCGASRNNANLEDDSVDIDALLGEADSTKARDAEEAEVLRLLGITPAEEQAQPAAIQTEQSGTERQGLESDINQLRNELTEKDQQISELRSELTQKEVTISELENQAKSPRRQTLINPTGGFSKPSPEFMSRYQAALSEYRAKNYQKAMADFNELLLSDPNNTLSDNCQYWIGECYYGSGNYNQAIVEFEKVFSFPNSNKNDDAQLKLGVTYIRLGDRGQAREEFNRLLTNYPNSEYAALARKYIGQL